MGLFQSKQQPKQAAPIDEATDTVAGLFDEHYRQELRDIGRETFTQILRDNAPTFQRELDLTVAGVGEDLKTYLSEQLASTLTHVNNELTQRLDERLAASDRVNKDAQDLVVQSLNRNAQALHDKYQQLSQTLQQTISSQEAMMITVFEENKARMTDTQGAQDGVMRLLQQNAQTSKDQSQQLSAVLQKNVADQEQRLEAAFSENTQQLAATFEQNKAQLASALEQNKSMFSSLYEAAETHVSAAKKAQDEALSTLHTSAQSLREQSQQLAATLQQSIADQKDIMTTAFQDNMAQIIEHYLLGALGDQYDMKAQLPSIIQQLEANKQAIMDDMKL